MTRTHFELKRIAPDGIPSALEKAQRYRLLNQPEQAESICRDIIAVDGDHQDALQVRLDGIEKRMRAQYTALDATMALLNSKSNYITQQIAAFNANNSSK